ncbi:MAG: hypothetical protein ACRDRE_21790 [Pseudonocardiaceae bacterium]
MASDTEITPDQTADEAAEIPTPDKDFDPGGGFDFKLRKTTPTEMTAGNLKEQLTRIGLTCEDSSIEELAKQIKETRGLLDQGKAGAWLIAEQTGRSSLPQHINPNDEDFILQLLYNEEDARPFINRLIGGDYGTRDFIYQLTGVNPLRKEFVDTVSSENPDALRFLARLDRAGLVPKAAANWMVVDQTVAGRYDTKLHDIQRESNFEWLKANQNGFTGKSETLVYKERVTTIDAVKGMFVRIARNQSAAVTGPEGLDPGTTEASFQKVIDPLDDASAKDYVGRWKSHVLFLALGYNPSTGWVKGLGIIGVDWKLFIKEYKEKKKAPKKDTTLEIKTRGVTYNTDTAIDRDHGALRQRDFHPGGRELTIFKELPPANADTWYKGLPATATTDELQSIVLYAPGLTNIGVLDNTDSDATATYTKSVATGFTFTTSHTITLDTSIEMSVEFVKSTLKVSQALTFTRQVTNLTTETMTFMVPPGKKAFTYQGYVMAALLTYRNGVYSYTEGGARFLTNALITNKKLILSS